MAIINSYVSLPEGILDGKKPMGFRWRFSHQSIKKPLQVELDLGDGGQFSVAGEAQKLRMSWDVLMVTLW